MKFYHDIREPKEDPCWSKWDDDMLHKFKYRMMWELRALEKEIDEEGGMLMLTWETAELWTKGFSPELDAKIWKVIRSIDWSKW